MNAITKFDCMYLLSNQKSQNKTVSNHKIKEHATILRDLDRNRHSLEYYKNILSQYQNNPLKFDSEFYKMRQAIFDSWG